MPIIENRAGTELVRNRTTHSKTFDLGNGERQIVARFDPWFQQAIKSSPGSLERVGK
ncbi:MAG TPA: hypothetical protein VMW42_08955 [Desulfatiglandales bacterium]|nr:hypothetical protein [Desulfatiglandales bacterium]